MSLWKYIEQKCYIKIKLSQYLFFCINLLMSQSISKPLNQSMKQSLQPINPTVIRSLPADRASVNQVQLQEDPTMNINNIGQTEKSKLHKRYKILTGVGICCFIFGLIFFLLLPPLIHMLIVKGAIDQAVLSPDNQKIWAHIPGDSGTMITRNYSFFNLANAEQFFLKGQKPKFLEAQGYIITQLEDYLDIKYNEDMTKVKLRDWLHFDQNEDSRSLEESFNILNLPSLGFWYTLKSSRDALIFIQGFALLFTSIQDSIIDTVIGQGISAQYLPDFDTTYEIFSQAGISRQNSKFLWDDHAYGFSDKNNIKYWVEAAKSSFNQNQTSFSELALDLKDYFTLSDSQVYYILNQINQFAESLEGLILENHYCQNITNCDGHQLAVRQLASSYVTFNTPPVSSITPTDTICTDNVTCNGYYPEIWAYYKNVYLIQHQAADPFLKFSPQMVGKWVNYNPTGKKGQYNKAQSCIMHIGNLDALFNNGTMHDKVIKNHFDSSEYLKNIQTRFQLPTQSHARVFWQWMKYLSSNLLRQKTQGNQKLGIANSFSSGIYDGFSYLQDHLQHYLLKVMVSNWLGQRSCNQLLKISLQSADQATIQNICNKYQNDIQSDEFVNDTISICRNKYRISWKTFIQLGATPTQLQMFCDRTIKGGFGELYHNMRKQLNDFYHCDETPNYYCSDYEIALKQWANSTVTMNQPLSAADKLLKALTFSQWDLNSSPIQLQYFSNRSQKPVPIITTTKAYQLFNFDNIFSATSNLKVFKDKQTTQTWRDYMRYIVVFVGFRGLTNQRTARQYIFGYNDQYLLWRKNNYPPFGGDPSTPAYTAFNDLNTTDQQATLQLQLHTGKDNSLMTAQYYKINGLRYLTTNYSRFNGNDTYWVLESPWQQIDYFYGTNGKSFSPDQPNSKNISIYVPNLQRYGSGSLQQSYPYDRYGYDLQIAYLGRYIYQAGEQYPDNRKYYQHFFGVFNETSVLGAPLFMTKHHFMNCSSNWSSYVSVYNEDATIQYVETSHWDDSYVIVQPYTGVSFQSTLFLQANYFHEPDELFTYNQTCMLPVFAIYRSGNLTETKAGELFDPLTTALNIKSAIFYIGIMMTLLGIGGSTYGYINIRRLKRRNEQTLLNKNESIKISLQPQSKPQPQPQIKKPKKINSGSRLKLNQSKLDSVVSQQIDN